MKQRVKLTIGGAQFGMDYGVTNRNGKIGKDEIDKIMHYAIGTGIDSLDTAAAYGDSEKIIGNTPICREFEVDTKLSISIREQDKNNLHQILEKRINKSLLRLKRKKIRVLYFHDINEQIERGLQWAVTKRNAGVIKEIGLSIYELGEIKKEWIKYLDTVQIPMSIYDRRAENHPMLKVLDRNGIKIRARSIFMQGLILEDIAKWPSYIDQGLREEHRRVSNEVNKRGVSMLEEAIGYIKSLGIAQEVIVGVTSKEELKEIDYALKKTEEITQTRRMNSSVFASKAVDPRFWGK